MFQDTHIWLFTVGLFMIIKQTNNLPNNNKKIQTIAFEVGRPLVDHQHPITHPFKSNARMRMCCNTSSEVIWGSTAKERNSGGKKLSHFWGEKTRVGHQRHIIMLKRSEQCEAWSEKCQGPYQGEHSRQWWGLKFLLWVRWGHWEGSEKGRMYSDLRFTESFWLLCLEQSGGQGRQQ